MPVGRRAPIYGMPAAAGATYPAPTARSLLSQAQQAPETGGVATVTLDAAPNGYGWLISMISLSTTSTQQTTADVYIGTPDPTGWVLEAATANANWLTGWPALVVPSNQPLSVVFSSMSAGSVATCRFQGVMIPNADIPAWLMGASSAAG